MEHPLLTSCPVTDITRLFCSHCGVAVDPDERDALAGLYGRSQPLPAPTVLPTPLTIGYASQTWRRPVPTEVRCEHGRPEGVVLCEQCVDDFAALLDDMPGLLADLEAALSKQVTFVRQGGAQVSRPDEAPMPYSTAASKVLADLTRRLDGPPILMARLLRLHWRDTLRRPDLERLAGGVSRAVVAAHRVIERPPSLVFYGQCPKCHDDIEQERIVVGDGRMVQCGCGYRATLSAHQAAQLDLAEDRWLTVTELLKVLNDGGEKTSRSDIDNLIYRQGLPRQREQRPQWASGRLVPHEVFTYRLGDTRTLLLAKRARRSA